MSFREWRKLNWEWEVMMGELGYVWVNGEWVEWVSWLKGCEFWNDRKKGGR